MLESLAGDLRFACRTLRKSPGFTLIAIATLAIGIGANTAVFSVVDSVILRPLAYPAADRLFVVHEVVPKFSHLAPLIPVNAMHFREWRKNARSFDELALLGDFEANLTGAGEPEHLYGGRVSPNLFRILGARPQLGRTFLEEEDQPGRDDVVVLDHALWMRRFSGDPRVIGRKIQLNGRAYEVIGVLPADFRFPKVSQLFAMTIAGERPQIWKPLAIKDSELTPMGDFNFVTIGRLKPGVAPSLAVSELNVIQARISNELVEAEKAELRAAIVPLDAQITGRARTGLELMLAAVCAILLIGCVNIANLLLARATGRRREMAIRSAMGASTGRLVRQTLVESLVLSGAGAVLALGVAWMAIRLIVLFAPADLPRLDEIRPDARLFLVAFALAAVAGCVSGLLPAWRAGRADPLEAISSAARGSTTGRKSGRLRSLLVALEVGLSAMCLIAAGLLVHSMVRLLQLDRGFDSTRILTVSPNLPPDRYPDLAKREAFIRTMLDRMSALPGVRSAAASSRLPLTGEGGNNLIGVEGTALPMMERPLADVRQVNPDYFRTMRIPLASGRIFRDADRGRSVALVSSLTAARLWPGADPIGRRFRIGADTAPLLEVVGVVGDVRSVSLNKAPNLTVYQPYWQRFYGEVSLAVRSASDPASLAQAVRGAIRAYDPELPIPAFLTMDEIVSESVAQRRFQTSLVLLFAGVALLLASLGIYGVISYAVAQRTQEMGIRMALGASPGGIRALVLRQGLTPVLGGLAVGMACGMALARVFGSLLFGVTASDPWTLAAVPGLLILVALMAIAVPARRATRVDPAASLKY